MFIIKDGAREEIELTHSNYEYYRAGIKTATFWRLRFDIDVTKTKKFELEVETCGNTYKLSYYFGPHVPLTQDKGQKIFFRDGRRYKEKMECSLSLRLWLSTMRFINCSWRFTICSTSASRTRG